MEALYRIAAVWCCIFTFASSPAFAQNARSEFISVSYLDGGLRIQIHDAGGRAVHTAEVPAVYAGAKPASAPRLEVLGPRAIAATWTPPDTLDHAFELLLRSDDETAYYGTGERFNALDQRGFILPVITDDRYGNKGVGTHKPVPFFMSSRGFGVWIDTFDPGVLDLSGTERHMSRLRFTTKRLRVVFIAGPQLTDILATYTALTGRPRVPPPWAFGLWKSRDVHHNQDSALVDIERLRRYGIPASVLVLDSPWETGYNDFTINRTQFPNPEALFRRIKQLGFELCLWLTPFVNDSNVIDMRGVTPVSSNFDEASREGHLVENADGTVALSRWWKGRGGLVDFTDPAAIAWWKRQLAKTKAYGARAFKADDGEGNFVPDARFHDGSTARTMKNRYALLYDSIMQAYIDEELDGNGVLIVRSAYTGAQRYPFAWAGDNHSSFDHRDGLPSVIIAGQNAAMSGFALWGTDIAGYAGRPSKEVFIRWTQHSTFTPFMQVHMTSNLGPWDFDDETLDIFRRYAVLRTRLFPYLYDAVHAAAHAGVPIIRPMAFAFPADAEARNHIYQYMYGPDLLVAPMYQHGSSRAVYLPAGDWIDYWSGARYSGPRMLDAAAPLERIPLYVRAGSILPMLPATVQTLVERNAQLDAGVEAIDDRRILEVWPGERGELRTWDGLHADLSRSGLRVSSTRPRPLEVVLIGRQLLPQQLTGAQVERAAGTTIIRWAKFSGEQTLTWQE